MTCRLEGGCVSCLKLALAVAVAQVRYWLTVAWRVRQQLDRWSIHARTVRDPVLRAYAAAKLREERGNTEAIATLCTLAPRRSRRFAIEAVVALQVMYDYLDALTEEAVADPFRDGRQLFRAFAVALTPGEAPVDYYRFHPRREDGYLDALVAVARASIAELPGYMAVSTVARAVAARFAEAQIRSHVAPTLGAQQLERWAAAPALATNLLWWEWAGGAAASVLGVHALLSAAADNRMTRAQALQLDDAYLLASTLTTLLDSAVDDERDAAERAHSYVAYYATVDQAARRIASIATVATTATRKLPHSSHHSMTVAGVAAFYLSMPAAWSGTSGIVGPRVVRALGPIALPILTILRLWRWASRIELRTVDERQPRGQAGRIPL